MCTMYNRTDDMVIRHWPRRPVNPAGFKQCFSGETLLGNNITASSSSRVLAPGSAFTVEDPRPTWQH